MLTITPHPVGFNVRGHLATPGAAPRSAGIHLSAIVRKMALQYGWLKPEYASDNLSDIINNTPYESVGESGNLTRIALGIAWEQWIVTQVKAWEKDFVHQPGEFIRDDIRVTPDGLAFAVDGSPIIHEFKLTYKSARRNVAEEIMWHVQMLGYAAALAPMFGMAKTMYLHVVYVNGDYSHGLLWGPKYRPFKITMDEIDVEQTWKQILENREGATEEMGDEVE